MILSNVFIVILLLAAAIYFKHIGLFVIVLITMLISLAMVIADVEGKKYLNKQK